MMLEKSSYHGLTLLVVMLIVDAVDSDGLLCAKSSDASLYNPFSCYTSKAAEGMSLVSSAIR